MCKPFNMTENLVINPIVAMFLIFPLLVFSWEWPSHREKHTQVLPSGVFVRETKLTPLLFVHIHKAGGTTICQIAHAAQIQTPQPARTSKDKATWFSKNCNPTFKDGYRGRAWGFEGPVAMLDYAKTVDMYAIEWPLPSQLPSDLNILLVLREPLHLFFCLCPEVQELQKDGGVASVVEKVRHCMLENKDYQTKYLAGCQSAGLQACHYSDIKTHNVKPEDVMVAKSIIERAAAVLITERLDESQPVILVKLGWNLTNSASQYRSGTRKEWVEKLPGWGPGVDEQTVALRSALHSWSPQLYSEFVKSNVYDQQLYNVASLRFSKLLAQSEVLL